jgi:RecA/RadA recombinase
MSRRKKEAEAPQALERQGRKLSERAKLLARFVDSSKFGEIEHVPFGVAPLDLFTRGGFVRGGITLLTGGEASGKTTSAILGIVSYQQAFPNEYVLYLNGENKLSVRWCQRLGVDLDRFKILYPESGEEGHALVKRTMNELPEFGMVVADSLVSLAPEAEIESNPVEDAFVAPGARMMNRMIREVNALQVRLFNQGRKVTILAINQEREKPSGTGRPISVVPVGRAQQFHASLWVRFLSSEFTIHQTLKIPTKVNFRFTIKKNSDSPSHMSGEFGMYLAPTSRHRVGDIDDYGFTTLWGRSLGLLVPKGSLGYSFMGETPMLRSTLLETWESDRQRYQLVKKAIFDAYWAAFEGDAAIGGSADEDLAEGGENGSQEDEGQETASLGK